MAEPLRKTKPLYDRDLHAWAEEQASHARAGRRAALDLDHIAEELESLGASQRREIRSRLTVLLCHLLKFLHQPHLRTRSWTATIGEQRRGIAVIVEESPSLAGHAAHVLDKAYADAREAAAEETGLPVETFAAECPFSIEQVLDRRWMP